MAILPPIVAVDMVFPTPFQGPYILARPDWVLTRQIQVDHHFPYLISKVVENEKDSGSKSGSPTGNQPEGGRGPSAVEISNWVGMDDAKRGRWVESGLVSYFGDA